MELKQKIKNRGLKIKFIAEKVGVSQPLLSMYLNGKRKMPESIHDNIEKILE